MDKNDVAERMTAPVDLPHVDLVSLQLALCCFTSGSITAAAPLCDMSVMGASDRLCRLEDAFSKPLFRRHRHGLDATTAARAAAQMLGVLHTMMSEIQAAEHVQGAIGQNTGRRGRRRREDSLNRNSTLAIQRAPA